MDISAMKTMLEIQAIQSMGNSQTSTQSVTGNPTVFTQLLEEMMTSSSLTNSASNILGSTYSQLHNPDSENNSSSMYLNSNTNYIPSSYYDALMQTTNMNNEVNLPFMKDYLNTSGFENVLAGAQQFSDIIAKASSKYGVPEKLIASVMKQESNFNTGAVSSAGATGLMQLMPGTARYLGVKDSFNAEQNIMGGTKYLSQMLNKFNNNIELALAAYNAGPGNVSKYGGVPPFKETMNYVNKVLGYYNA